jgi:DNA-binding transcriptional MerR regulator
VPSKCAQLPTQRRDARTHHSSDTFVAYALFVSLPPRRVSLACQTRAVTATVLLKTAALKMLETALDQNDFLEFLMLEPGEPQLVTKSELLEKVKSRGLAISARQLTFYVTEGLLPKSVRVGSRAGVYPLQVVDLLSWILRSREMGIPVEAIKELIPLWKYLMRSRNDGILDLAEFEYIARQKLSSFDAVLAVPELVTFVLFNRLCADCRKKLDIKLLDKDGKSHPINDPETTIGFAAVKRVQDESATEKTDWFGYRRITLASPPTDYAADPTTVVLGVSPDEAVPPSPGQDTYELSHDHSSVNSKATAETAGKTKA